MTKSGNYRTILNSITLMVMGIWMASYSVAQCIDPPSGLVSWWPGDGTPADLVSAFDGQPAGDAGFSPGWVGDAFSLDGDGDYITVPHDPSLQPPQITVNAWIRGQLAVQPDPLAVIIDKSHGFVDQTGWALQTDHMGRATFAYGNGVGFPEVISSSNVLDDQWHLITASLDGIDIRIYVDGQLENTLPYWGIPAKNDREVHIGASFGGPVGFSRFFFGLVDEVDIYDRALTEDEIFGLFTAGVSGKCQPPSSLTIKVDIKPGGESNSINCNNDNGVIAVAILTTSLAQGEALDFDATTVDETTVSFQGALETHHDRRSGTVRRHQDDVDGDGDTDLIFHFRMRDTDLTCQDSLGSLVGETFDGVPVMGHGNIHMVGGTRVITVGTSRRSKPNGPKAHRPRKNRDQHGAQITVNPKPHLRPDRAKAHQPSTTRKKHDIRIITVGQSRQMRAE